MNIYLITQKYKSVYFQWGCIWDIVNDIDGKDTSISTFMM